MDRVLHLPKLLGVMVLALAGSGCAIGLNGWSGEASFATSHSSEPVAGDERLEARIELNVGELQISPGPAETLYESEIYYNELAFQPRVEFNRENGVGRLQVGLDGQGSFRGAGKNSIEVRLNPNVPLNLDVNSGVGESRIELSGMSVVGLAVQAGVGETRVSMLSPNQSSCGDVEIHSGVGALEFVGLGNLGFRRFAFRGGVGGSKLDFTGEWKELGEISIEVGVGEVEVILPRSIGAEVRVSKGFFSEFQMREFRKQGDTYSSENIDRVDKVVRVRVQAGIGGVGFRWI
jgi:hypothetical protein